MMFQDTDASTRNTLSLVLDAAVVSLPIGCASGALTTGVCGWLRVGSICTSGIFYNHDQATVAEIHYEKSASQMIPACDKMHKVCGS